MVHNLILQDLLKEMAVMLPDNLKSEWYVWNDGMCGMVVCAKWWYMGNGICGMRGAEWQEWNPEGWEFLVYRIVHTPHP